MSSKVTARNSSCTSGYSIFVNIHLLCHCNKQEGRLHVPELHLLFHIGITTSKVSLKTYCMQWKDTYICIVDKQILHFCKVTMVSVGKASRWDIHRCGRRDGQFAPHSLGGAAVARRLWPPGTRNGPRRKVEPDLTYTSVGYRI